MNPCIILTDTKVLAKQNAFFISPNHEKIVGNYDLIDLMKLKPRGSEYGS